jgi:hypothetical protein
MLLKRVLAAAGLAAATVAFQTVVAAPLMGMLLFTDGFNNLGSPGAGTTSVVSQLTEVNPNPTAAISTCSGTFQQFCPSNTPLAFEFMIGQPGQILYTFAGFDFLVNDFSDVVRTQLSCANGSCADALAFSALGIVSCVTAPCINALGFSGGDIAALSAEPSSFLLNWSAQGACNQAAPNATQCNGEITSASWSVNISVPAPEPGAISLVGLALGLLAYKLRWAIFSAEQGQDL